MPANSTTSGMRGNYQRRMLEVRGAFEAGGASGAVTIAARAAAVDELVKELWRQAVEGDSRLGAGVALVAIGGVWRRGVFSFFGVDLLFFVGGGVGGEGGKGAVWGGEAGGGGGSGEEERRWGRGGCLGGRGQRVSQGGGVFVAGAVFPALPA